MCTKGDHLVRGSKNCLSEYVWVEVLDTPVQKNADMHSYAEKVFSGIFLCQYTHALSLKSTKGRILRKDQGLSFGFISDNPRVNAAC